MTFRLINADCVEAMQAMAENSVDAIVTDPPYGLEFMGKEWDRLAPTNGSVAYRPTGDSTSPIKSTFKDGVGTRVGAPKKNPRCRRCTRLKFDHEPRRCTCETPDWDTRTAEYARTMQEWHHAWATEALRILKPGGYLVAAGGTRTYHRLTCAVEDAGFEIRDCIAWLYGSGFPKSLNVGDGWGTALKPAFEPWVLARKPLSERNVAANVQRWGTGALNVDGCRIGTEDVLQGSGTPPLQSFGADNHRPFHDTAEARGVNQHEAGRWPANVTLDETAAAMLDEQTGELTSSLRKLHHEKGRSASVYEMGMEGTPDGQYAHTYGDTGGASRFFYCPKADREERNRGLGHMAQEHSPDEGYGSIQTPILDRAAPRENWQPHKAANHHPTVKPVELMRWLCRMVTPKGGTVLDPFTGSGSTGVAAMREGFEFIGIEREAEYVEIARARIIGDAPLFNVEDTDAQPA